MSYITSEELIGILKRNNEDLIAIVEKNCKKSTMGLGINADKPQEMQELMSLLRELKLERASIKAKLTGLFINSIWALLIFLIVAGFTFYCTKQVPIAVRDEKGYIEKSLIDSKDSD